MEPSVPNTSQAGHLLSNGCACGHEALTAWNHQLNMLRTGR